MTIDDVREEVARIERAKGDYEIAHGLEDDLYQDVLAAIARGETDDPTMLAAEALKATEIDFPRYRA